MHTNNNKNIYFKSLSSIAKPLAMFHNPNATIPTLIIESGVTLGRTNAAYKKSGKIEATERFVEQGTSAVVWLWGVQAFKKIGELIGKKIFKINDMDFDVGFDYLRNPLENISKRAMNFKIANILTSTALATVFIGFVLPKINHLITNKTLSKQKQAKKEKSYYQKQPSFKDFKKSLKSSSSISFTSLSGGAKYITHLLENNSTARLLMTDTGVVSGRFYNGRNKYERIENIFRDVSSIYFYLFSTNHIVKLLNKLTGNTNINPEALKATVEMLGDNLEKTKTDKFNFLNKVKSDANITDLRKIEKLFKDNKVVTLEQFNEIFPSFTQKANSISKLQPELSGKRLLTKLQAIDVVSHGWVNDDKFLHELYSKATKGKYNRIEKFISAKEIDNIRTSVDEFTEQINKEAQKTTGLLDKKFIEKVANKNMFKNFAYYAVGTAISIFALGTLIPKIQYMIRKKLTNNDEFVGIKEYKN